MEFKGKYILVLGAGRTGLGIAKVLHSLGANVTVNDGGDPAKLKHDIEILEELGVNHCIGHHPLELIDPRPEFIVKNPGIPLEIPFLRKCSEMNIPIITDIELINHLNDAPLVAITGTNGKTTVTSFVGHLFSTAGLKTAVGGNIGVSIAESIYQKQLDVIVAEVSSFQLECTIDFKPKISVITNFSPDHLDRHKTFDNYVAQKKKIFSNQDSSDATVLNMDNEVCKNISKESRGNIYWFSSNQKVTKGAYIENDKVYWCKEGTTEEICPISVINILGKFNQENILAGIIVGKLMGLENKEIIKAIESFKGVEHRLEYVGEIDCIRYFNDSKATNTDSTIKALEAFKEPVILLLGGYDKGEDFEQLANLVKSKAKKVVLFGVTGERIKGYLNTVEYTSFIQVKTFEEAVLKAKEAAKKGDIVLLSPACASWDEFQNFEQRGRFFKELITQ